MIRSVRQFIKDNQDLIGDVPALLNKARTILDLPAHRNLLSCLYEAKIDVPADKVFPMYKNCLMTFTPDITEKYEEQVSKYYHIKLPLERTDLTMEEVSDRLDNCNIGHQTESLVSHPETSTLQEISIYPCCYDGKVMIEMSLRDKRNGDVIFVAIQMMSGVLYDNIGYWLLEDKDLQDQVDKLKEIVKRITE